MNNNNSHTSLDLMIEYKHNNIQYGHLRPTTVNTHHNSIKLAIVCNTSFLTIAVIIFALLIRYHKFCTKKFLL